MSEPLFLEGKLYVFRAFLKDYGISESYLDKQTSLARKGRTRFYKSINWQTDKRFNLIEYKSIPQRTGGSVGKKYELPEEEELFARYKEMKEKELATYRQKTDDILTLDIQLDREKDHRRVIGLIAEFENIKDYDYFIQSKDVSLKDYQARGLSRWAAIMRLMHQATDYWVSENFNRINSVRELREIILKHIATEKNVDPKHYYGLNITNTQVFSRRVKEFGSLEGAEALKSLINGRFSNANALKRTFDHEAILFGYYTKSEKLDLRETHRRYVFHMLDLGIERQDCLGYGGARTFLMRDDIQAKAASLRHGKKYAEEKHQPMHHRLRPDVALEMVSGDGLWFGLPVKAEPEKVWDNVKKKYLTKQTISKLISFIWYDVTSGAIVGWKHNYGRGGETNAMIRESFRRIGTMTGGYFPEEIQLDKKATQNKHIQSFINRLGVKCRAKKPHNPKESMAERFHKELNKLLRHNVPEWINTTNHKIDFVHNPDKIKYNLNDAVPVGKAVGLIDMIFTIYNNMPQERLGGLTPIEHLKANISTTAKQYSEFNQDMLFNETRTATVKNGIFRIKFEKEEYEYEVPNWHEVIGTTNNHNEIRVYFNERHLEKVQICSFDDLKNPASDKYICDCEPVQRYNQSSVNRTKAEGKIIGHHEKRIRKFNSFIEKTQNEYSEQAIDLGGILESNQDSYKEYLQKEAFAEFINVENIEAAERGVNVVYPQLQEEKQEVFSLKKEFDKAIAKEKEIDFDIYND